MGYFILTSGEDGTRVEQVAHSELLRRITPNAAGETYYGCKPITFLNRIPDSDKGCWMAPDGSVLIIKGEIAVPKVIQAATRYEI